MCRFGAMTTSRRSMPVPSGHTVVCAILGDPVAHSLSPAMHSGAWAAMGRDAVYVACRATERDIVSAAHGLFAAGLLGANVTAPLKELVQAACVEVSEAAEIAESVNTLVRTEEGWRGESTDGDGYVRWLCEEGIGVEGAAYVVLGSGGAARSVALSLLEAGASSVRAAVRDTARAARTTRGIARQGGARWSVVGMEEVYAGSTLGHCDVLISSIPAAAITPPLAQLVLSRVRPQTVIADMAYGVAGALLCEAGGRGHRVHDGKGMLLHQAVLSAALWWGEEPPLEIYRSALEAATAM